MTRTVTLTEAKAKLSALLDEVEQGEEIEITRRGKLVARLNGAPRGPLASKGMFAGRVFQNCSDEELYSTGETWEAS
jgi:prevent-host-death family protein